MEIKVIEWINSNIEVKLNIDLENYNKFKQSALKEFSKNIQVSWYRKWYAPADEIEKRVNPQYLENAIYENAINNSLKELIWKYKLIGQIYDLNPWKKDDNLIISFKVDIYPEVKIKNNNFENIQLELPSKEVTKEEIEKALESLKMQFATYKDIEKVDIKQGIVKLDLEYQDENSQKLAHGKIFLGKEDFEEFPIFKEIFQNKENGYSYEFDYTEEIPTLLKYFKKDKDKLNIKKLKANITEIKKVELPEMNLENIKNWFGKTYDKIEDFIDEIKTTLANEKEKNEISKFVEKLALKISDSFEVYIPKTLIEQEVLKRTDYLKQRYGGEKNFEKMLKNMKSEEVKKMYDELYQVSRESVKNFFILMKFAEEKGLVDKIDFNKDWDFEEKLLSLFEKETK